MKINKISYIGMALAMLFAGSSLSTAQTQHQFGLHVGGGLSTLRYNPSSVSSTLGLGGNVGLDYNFFFAPKWGIGTGVEAALFNGKYSLNDFSDSYDSNDGVEAFEFRYTLSKISEKHKAMMLNIPLMLRFRVNAPYPVGQSPEGGDASTPKHAFTFGLGGKIGFALSSTFDNSAALVTEGYYDQYKLLLTAPRYKGFGAFDNVGNSGDISLKPVFFLSADIGMQWYLSNKWSLFTGLYIDYGLNNVLDPETNAVSGAGNVGHAVAYNPAAPADYRLGSLAGTTASAAPDKASPLAAGLKVTLFFGTAPKNKAQAKRNKNDDEAAQLAADKQRQAEEQRIAEEKAKAEEQRIAEEKQLVAESRQRDLSLLEKPVSGYSLRGDILNSPQKAELDQKIILLKRNPDVKVVIEGHTCDVGTHEYNVRLGNSRAVNARGYMLSQGVPAEQIVGVESHAETEPLVANTDEENRRINRRVQLRIVKP